MHIHLQLELSDKDNAIKGFIVGFSRGWGLFLLGVYKLFCLLFPFSELRFKFRNFVVKVLCFFGVVLSCLVVSTLTGNNNRQF